MQDWTKRILDGDLRAMARAATVIESRRPEACELLSSLFRHTGKASILGITGPPGAGKSTLVDQLIRVLRNEGKSVAVVAVDPTSPFSGGAILGDRIRMESHHADAGVFIRSMATRGNLGGLAPATMDMTLLLDAAGWDVVLIETVGVGQDEVEIARLADATAVILVPGMGDDVQALKAGILEIGDVFIINKSDLPGADRLARELQGALSLAVRADHWTPPIVRSVASSGEGIGAALDALRSYLAAIPKTNRSAAAWTHRLRQMLRERLLERISNAEIDEAACAIAEHRQDPYSVTERLLARFSSANAR
jgi:LAO/AO transport system kinase